MKNRVLRSLVCMPLLLTMAACSCPVMYPEATVVQSQPAQSLNLEYDSLPALPGTGILSHDYEEREVPRRISCVRSMPVVDNRVDSAASRDLHNPLQPAGAVDGAVQGRASVVMEVSYPSRPRMTLGTSSQRDEAVPGGQQALPVLWKTLAREAEEIFGLEAALILAVIRTESDFDHMAESHAGAQGAMQIMPDTQDDLGLIDPFDPRANVYAGSQYLMQQFQRFGSPELALAAYNAGPGNVEKYGGIPPFEETQNFVRRVMSYWKAHSHHP